MYNTDNDRKKLAKGMHDFLCELVRVGFSREEALMMVLAYMHAHCGKSSF